MNKINVFEIKVKVYLRKKLSVDDSLQEVTKFIDSCLCKNELMQEWHYKQEFKLYSHDNLFPIPQDKEYKGDNNYTFTIRTVDSNFAKYLNENLYNQRTQYFIGLTTNIRILPKKVIHKVYTLTSCIIKNEDGYWRNSLSIDEYINRLRISSIRKLNQFIVEKIDEDILFLEKITFRNKLPVKFKMKDVNLLGDQLEIIVPNNSISQDLYYFLLGVGLGELSSRGAGFLNYRGY